MSAPRPSSAKLATARRRSSTWRASARTKSSRKPRARPRAKRSGWSLRHTTKWRVKPHGRAKAWPGTWAGLRSRARRACWTGRSIRRLTPSCWTNWPPRLRVAERATIARPYAKAAFEYARDANAFAGWSKGLKLAGQIVADPRVAALTKSPLLTAADLAGVIIDVASAALDAGMQNFVRVLAENHRLLLLPEIAAHYEELRAAVENTLDVEVISAVTLSDAQADKLKQALSTRLKRTVRMQNSVDSTLLGGAVVRAGDLVIDGSLKGRLERLATDLTR